MGAVTDPERFQALSAHLLAANRESAFFAHDRLGAQLEKRRQALASQYLQQKFSWSVFKTLGWKEKARWIGVNPFILRNFWHIDKGDTLRLRKHNTNQRGFSAIAMKGSRISLSPTSGLTVKQGRLTLNAKWSPKDPASSLLVMNEDARLVCEGSFDIYSGARIYVNKGATLRLGGGYVNHDLNLSCFEGISIGKGVVISENVTVRDSDDHTIVGSDKPMTQPIVIGDHVWIGMNVTILKGVTIGNGAIIAAGAVVTRDVPENALAGGVPARVLKTGVSWY